MRLKQDKIEYNESEIEAQGCWNDCMRVAYYYNNGQASEPVNGPAITQKCGRVIEYSAKGSPFN